MKRLIAALLSFALLLSGVPVTAFGVDAETQTEAAVDTTDIAVEGTNSFGNMLSEAITEDQQVAAEQYETGYAITGLVIEGDAAAVSFSTLEDAHVVVALYTEDGMQMIASATAAVTADETEAVVIFTADMPEYFMASAFLLDSQDFSPLCKAYETPMYTQQMQKLLTSTAEDYDRDRVLLLDSSTDTNFAVYTEDTVIIPSANDTNSLVSTDNEKGVYVFQNPDATVSSLQAGDILAYSTSEEQLLILRVDAIESDGSTVTITGSEPQLEEAFQVLKLESQGTSRELQVTEDSGDDRVTYLGTVEYTEEEAASASFSTYDGTTVGKTFATSFGFEDKGEASEDGSSESVTAKVTVDLSLNLSLSYYLVPTRQWVEFKADSSAKIYAETSGKWTDTVKLKDLGYAPCVGVMIKLSPHITMEVSGKVASTLTICHCIGFSFDTQMGFQNLSTVPRCTYLHQTECSISVSLDLKPNLSLVFDALTVGISCPIGLRVDCKMTGSLYESVDSAADKYPASVHNCQRCLQGEVFATAKVSVVIQVFGSDDLQYSQTFTDVSVKLYDFYYSLDQDVMNMGTCSNIDHRVIFAVENAQYENAANVQIRLDDGDWSLTNKYGLWITYVPAGTYAVSVRVSDQLYAYGIYITGASVVRVVAGEGATVSSNAEDSATLQEYLQMLGHARFTDEDSVIGSGSCGSSAYWTLYSSGVMRIYGSGDTRSHSSRITVPWRNLTSYIKKVIIEENITSIGSFSFYNCSNVTSISIPSTLGSTGQYSFYGCHSLSTVFVADITSWMDISFNATSGNPMLTGTAKKLYIGGKLATEVVIPSGITRINDAAFYNCPDLTKITFCDTVTSIGSRAFYSCTGLTQITLPNNLLSTGVYAFGNCTGLTSIVIPDSVTAIGDHTFYQCYNLAQVQLGSNVLSIGNSAFLRCSALSNIQLPDSLVSIGGSAFNECTALTEIALPDSVTTLGDYAFNKCTALTEVSFGSGLVTIGNYAFYLTGITSVLLPDSVTTIGNYAFCNCTGLTQVKLGAGIVKIGDYAFHGCTEATGFVFPDTLTSIGSYAFYNCQGLTQVRLPDCTTTIGQYAFCKCSNLESVSLGNGLTSLGDSAFRECHKLTQLQLPDSLTRVFSYTFYNCKSLRQVTFGSNVSQISDYAFYGCSSLKDISLPEDLSFIGSYVFYGCSVLETVILPEGLTYLGSYSFNSCGSLIYISIPSTLSTVGGYVFSGCNSLAYVNVADLTSWMSISFNNPSAIPLLAGSLSKTLYINGELVTELVIPDGTVTIPQYAFYNCDQISSVTIPYTVTSIGAYAFGHCDALTELDIPYGVTSIGERSFESCKSLTEVTLSGSVTSIGEYSFLGCSSLDSVVLSDSLTTIGKAAFMSCTALSVITIPDTVTTIDDHAFSHCTSLVLIDLSANMTAVNYRSFDSCTSLQSITIPASVTLIDTYAFDACSSLSVITFLGNRPSIYTYAFTGVAATAYYPKGNTTWDGISGGYSGSITWVSYPASTESTEENTAMVAARYAATRSTVHGGEYSTEVTDTYVIKTAAFSELVPAAQYVMISVVSLDADDILAADNLLYIAQSEAGEDGTLSFSYVQRELTPVSYVMLFGTSGKDLNDAQITFPEMTADGYTQLVEPVVVYDGSTLVRDVDYVVTGATAYADPGQYTCYIRGIYSYTGTVECSYSVTLPKVAAVYRDGTQTGSYSALSDAIDSAQATENAYVQLLTDVDEAYTISGQLWIDLNSYDLSGVTVAGTVYGMDSATDDYTDMDFGKLSCTLSGDGKIVTQHKTELSGDVKRYLAVENTDGSYGFHRFYLGITKLSLKPSNMGIGYKAVFAGSETVKAQLDPDSAFGYTLWIYDGNVITRSMTSADFSPEKEVTLRISNILSPENSTTVNQENAELDIHATVFMKFKDGQVITSTEYVYSFRDMMEAANESFSSYTDEQQALLKKIAEDYADVMTDWSISNITQ